VLRFRIGQTITPIVLPKVIERHRPRDAIVPSHARTLHAPKYRRRETGDAKLLSRPPAPSSASGRGTLLWLHEEKNLQRHAHDVSGGRARLVMRSQRMRRRRAR